MVFVPSLDIVFFRSGFSLVRGLVSSLDLGISIGEFVFCFLLFFMQERERCNSIFMINLLIG